MAVSSRRSLCLLMVAAFVGCESAPPPVAQKKAEPKALAPVSALSAVYKMYVLGRSWAADLEPLEVTSIPLKEMAAKDGLYGAWQCVFVSPSKKMKKTYTFSLVDLGENLHEGVFGAPEESYDARGGTNVSFIMAAFRTDSPDALKTALEKGGAAFQAKNPKLPVMFKLERGRRDAEPVWQVYWGASPLDSPYSVFINADTGAYMKTIN